MILKTDVAFAWMIFISDVKLVGRSIGPLVDLLPLIEVDF